MEPRPAGSDYDGSEDQCYFGDRKYVGKRTTPEFEAWNARQKRCEAEHFGVLVDGSGDTGFDR